MSATDKFSGEIDSFNCYLEEKGLEKSRSETLKFLQSRERVFDLIDETFPLRLQGTAIDSLVGEWKSVKKAVNLSTLEDLLGECTQYSPNLTQCSPNLMRDAYCRFVDHPLFELYAEYEHACVFGED